MNNKLRIVLISITAAIFICCGVGVGYNFYLEQQAKKDYEQSADLILLPDYDSVLNMDSSNKEIDSYALELAKINLSALKQENEDVVGWITIPDTNISYPLTQGDDNNYYLNHTWKRSWNSSGAIFIDYRSSDAFNDFNTIIYGHRMRNETMFGPLKHYDNEDYLTTHPSVYIVNENSVCRYDIFAAYETAAKNGHTYRLGLNTDSGKTAYINYCLKNSVIDSGIIPAANDTLITLSTCTENNSATRWVVHAVLSYKIAYSYSDESTD